MKSAFDFFNQRKAPFDSFLSSDAESVISTLTRAVVIELRVVKDRTFWVLCTDIVVPWKDYKLISKL